MCWSLVDFRSPCQAEVTEENWYKGSSTSINIRIMEITTVSLDKSTRNGLRSIKEEQGFDHYDQTVAWLIKEVNSND